jgi:hypothetical protein
VREQDVRVEGRVLAQLTPGDAQWAPTYQVEVHEQTGQHHSGSTAHVTARTVRASPTWRMREAGVVLRVGDVVALLCNPWVGPKGEINSHVCKIIRIAHHDHADAQKPPPRGGARPVRRVGTHGGYQ